MKYYLLFALVFLLGSCQISDNDTLDAVDKPLSTWAEAYFGFDYEEALDYMTPESEKWIRFAASNITEKDVAFINEHNRNVKTEIIDRYIMAGDTSCSARIRVSDFVQLGFVGQEDKVINQAEYQITLVKRDDKWKVKMEGPLQSGKQSRD
ncbi:MAG: hypothetical protein IJ552_09370 [Prevotella sp.]|nr:hypothetical protein [Prevotella sp.]